MYLEGKISLSKLFEFTFLLGTIASVLSEKENVSKDSVEGAYTNARYVLVDVLQALPKTATDEDIEDYIFSGKVLDNIVAEKAFSILDTLAFNIINEAISGGASASTIDGDIADLIASEQGIDIVDEKLLDLVDDMPTKKLDA